MTADIGGLSADGRSARTQDDHSWPAGARVLDRWLPSATTRTDVPLEWLLRAKIAEQLGDTERAAVLYRRVATVWRSADAVLKPRLDEARAGLARVARK